MLKPVGNQQMEFALKEVSRLCKRLNMQCKPDEKIDPCKLKQGHGAELN